MIQGYLHQKILKIIFLIIILFQINDNLIDQIFKFKEKKTKPFYSLKKNIVGETHQSKILKITNFLKSNKADYLFVALLKILHGF